MDPHTIFNAAIVALQVIGVLYSRNVSLEIRNVREVLTVKHDALKERVDKLDS